MGLYKRTAQTERQKLRRQEVSKIVCVLFDFFPHWDGTADALQRMLAHWADVLAGRAMIDF